MKITESLARKNKSSNGHYTCGEHEIIAKNKMFDFHLGFFVFSKENNGSFIVKEYYIYVNKKYEGLHVLKRYIPKNIVDLIY